MGQGIVTSLRKWPPTNGRPTRVDRHVMGTPISAPMTWGHSAPCPLASSGPPLRAAAAEARAVLLDLGAQQLKVPAAELGVDKGVVFVRRTPTGA